MSKCPANSCVRTVTGRNVWCLAHWKMIPRSLRQRLNRLDAKRNEAWIGLILEATDAVNQSERAS